MQYAGPAAIGQGALTGINIANAIQQGQAAGQQQAIQFEDAKRKAVEYQETMKPIPLQEIAKTLPDFLHTPMLALAHASGVVEKDGDMMYIRKGNLKQFMDDFGKNKVQQAAAYEGAKTDLNNRLKQTDAAIAPLKKQLMGQISYYDNMLKEEETQASEAGTVPNPAKIKKINADKQAFLSESQEYKQLMGLEKQKGELTNNFHRVIGHAGMLDDEFKKNAEKYGEQNAVLLSLGKVSRYELDKQIKEMEQRARYQAMAEEEEMKQRMITEREVKVQKMKGTTAEKIAGSRDATLRKIAGMKLASGVPYKDTTTGQTYISRNGDLYYANTNQLVEPDDVDKLKLIKVGTEKEGKKGLAIPDFLKKPGAAGTQSTGSLTEKYRNLK